MFVTGTGFDTQVYKLKLKKRLEASDILAIVLFGPCFGIIV